jgi:hypothetical protein
MARGAREAPMRWYLTEDEVEHEIQGEIELDDLADECVWLDGEWPSDTCDQDEVADEMARLRFEDAIPPIDHEDLEEQYLAAEERWMARLAIGTC